VATFGNNLGVEGVLVVTAHLDRDVGVTFLKPRDERVGRLDVLTVVESQSDVGRTAGGRIRAPTQHEPHRRNTNDKAKCAYSIPG